MRHHAAGATLGYMQNRVLDRSAAHAAPGQLAVRDWLLVALSFSTGIYEAISFLTFGKVFTAFQTGNIVLLGVGIAGTRPPAGPNAVTAVVSLAAFAAGAVVAMRILPSFDGNEAIADDDVFQVWERPVSVTLGIALVLQAGFLAGWLSTPSPARLAYFLVALCAFAMGLQMNAIRALQVPGVSTTAFTATYIAFASGIATWSLTEHAVRRLGGTIVAMVAGAFLGDWMLSHAHAYAPVVPVAVTAAVITVAWVALRPRSRQSASVRRDAPSQLPSPASSRPLTCGSTAECRSACSAACAPTRSPPARTATRRSACGRSTPRRARGRSPADLLPARAPEGQERQKMSPPPSPPESYPPPSSYPASS